MTTFKARIAGIIIAIVALSSTGALGCAIESDERDINMEAPPPKLGPTIKLLSAPARVSADDRGFYVIRVTVEAGPPVMGLTCLLYKTDVEDDLEVVKGADPDTTDVVVTLKGRPPNRNYDFHVGGFDHAFREGPSVTINVVLD